MSSSVWFTVKEKKWKVGFFGEFHWTGKEEYWDSDNCTVTFARTVKDQCLIVIHSSQTKYSSYMQKDVLLRYMLGFEISTAPMEPKEEAYTARANIPKRSDGPKPRWVMQLDGKHWIWQWAQPGQDIKDCAVYKLYRDIVAELEHPMVPGDNIIKAPLDATSLELVPVVYQPSVDALKNFVREVHCAKSPTDKDGSYTLEVSMLFDNERLRQHGFLNTIYEFIRRLLYGRVMDLESFKILVAKNLVDDRFIFEGIYSNNAEMNADSIHCDKPPPPAPQRPIKYYFMNRNSPVIFINTSNHAMAEHDTNNKIWKWEYIPWSADAPIKLGSLTRAQLEERLRNGK